MKTKAEKLKAVTDDIRVKLPRLMKLEKGCLIGYNNSAGICEVITTYIGDNRLLVSWYGETESEMLSRRKLNAEKSLFHIIGKEIQLNDVLEWHSQIKNSNSHFQVNNGVGVFYSYPQSETEGERTIEVDLSKPYLKDQSEELINFLYELL